jgi:hypothetical protein
VLTKYADRDTSIPTPEDVIIMKLRWALKINRPKDRDDDRDVLAVQKGKLDMTYVESWCDRHGTRALLEDLCRSVADI